LQLQLQRRQFLLDAFCEGFGKRWIGVQQIAHHRPCDLYRLDNFAGDDRTVVDRVDEHRHFAEHAAGSVNMPGTAAFRGNPFAGSRNDEKRGRRACPGHNDRLKRAEYTPRT